MKNLMPALAAVLTIFTAITPSVRAEDKGIYEEAFPERHVGDDVRLGIAEIVAPAAVSIPLNGDNDMKILRAEMDFAEFQKQAQREVLDEKPWLAEIAAKDERYKRLELYRTEGPGLRPDEKLEHAALKKEMADKAGDFDMVRRRIENRRQEIMKADKVFVKDGVWMSPERAHQRRMRILNTRKAFFIGVPALLAVDGALRVREALNGRSTGVSAIGSVIQ